MSPYFSHTKAFFCLGILPPSGAFCGAEQVGLSTLVAGHMAEGRCQAPADFESASGSSGFLNQWGSSAVMELRMRIVEGGGLKGISNPKNKRSNNKNNKKEMFPFFLWTWHRKYENILEIGDAFFPDPTSSWKNKLNVLRPSLC
jgi:hypothetical protein